MFELGKNLLIDDRRLSNRVLAQWMIARGQNRYPRRLQINSKAFAKDWANCFMLKLGQPIMHSRVTFLGQALRSESWSPTIPLRLQDYNDRSLVRVASTKIGDLVTDGELIFSGGRATHRSRPILYRSIILPLSDDGDTIDGVLGAINFREMTAARDGYRAAPPPLEIVRFGVRINA